jgi:hypothetical protein
MRFLVGRLLVRLSKHKGLKPILILPILFAGGTKLNCPKCHNSRNIVCLAGGIALAQAQQMHFYCLTCKQDYIATKKEELETEPQHLSFEAIAIDQNLTLPRLSGNRHYSLKRFGPKRKEP